jgi:hypothetical protein
MVDRNILAAKLAELADRVERARAHCPATVDELRANRDALDVGRTRLGDVRGRARLAGVTC